MPSVSGFMPRLNQGGTAWIPQSWDPNNPADVIANKAAAVMVNGDKLFDIVGPIELLDLQSECVTANDGTASTVKYTFTPTGGVAVDLSAASASLASAAIGAKLIGAPLATLVTAAALAAAGIALLPASGGIVLPTGALKIVVAVGSTTGTWKHLARYRTLGSQAAVS